MTPLDKFSVEFRTLREMRDDWLERHTTLGRMRDKALAGFERGERRFLRKLAMAGHKRIAKTIARTFGVRMKEAS